MDKKDVRIEEFKGLRVAYLRKQGHFHEVAPALMRQLREFAGRAGHHGSNAQYLSIVSDDPRTNPHGQVHVDACVTVTPDYRAPAGSELALRDIEPGLYAAYRHIGSYKGLRDAWARLSGLPMPSNVHLIGPCVSAADLARLPKQPSSSKRDRLHAPSFEIYLNDPSRTPEAELATDLYQPIEGSS